MNLLVGLDGLSLFAILGSAVVTLFLALSPAMPRKRRFNRFEGGGHRLPAFAPNHLSHHADANTQGAK